MLQLSVSFYLPPNADHAAIARTLAELSTLTGPAPAPTTNVQVVNVEKPADVPAAAAPVLAGPGSTEAPKRGRGRPRKDGSPAQPSAPPVAEDAAGAVVDGVDDEPAHNATPAPAQPAKQTKVAPAAAALEEDLFDTTPAKEAPKVTLEQLTGALRAYVGKHGAVKGQALFAAAGFSKLGEVPPEAYGELYRQLTAAK